MTALSTLAAVAPRLVEAAERTEANSKSLKDAEAAFDASDRKAKDHHLLIGCERAEATLSKHVVADANRLAAAVLVLGELLEWADSETKLAETRLAVARGERAAAARAGVNYSRAVTSIIRAALAKLDGGE